MLWNASAIKGYAIAARDGQIGTVSDFLFDDASWLVRYWSSIPANGYPVAKSFCLPPSWGISIPRERNSRLA